MSVIYFFIFFLFYVTAQQLKQNSCNYAKQKEFPNCCHFIGYDKSDTHFQKQSCRYV